MLSLNNPYPAKALDSESGGITETGIYQSSLPNAGGTTPVLLGYFTFTAVITTTIAPGFCFVPRYSALDIPPAFSTTTGTISGGYSNFQGVNVTYADDYITQEKRPGIANAGIAANLAHTTFTARQTEWLFDKMQNNVPLRAKNCTADCPTFYDYLQNQSQPVITDNGNGNYSTFAAQGMEYIWSVDNGLVILSGQGTPNVLVSSSAVPATVSVIVKTRCWTITLNGFVPSCVGTIGTLSYPPTSTTSTPSGIINEYSACLFATFTNIGVTYSNASITNNAIIWINNVPYIVPSPTAGEIDITVSGQIIATIYPTGRVKFRRYGTYTTFAVGCGPSLQYIIRIVQQSPGCKIVAEVPKNPDITPSGSAKINFVVSPNPSSGNEITISQEVSRAQGSSETSASGEEQSQSEAKIEEFTLILYNKFQQKVRETTLNTLSKTISTEGLPNDVYFLHIISKDGSKVVKQVMILR